MNDEDFMKEAIKDAIESKHRFGAVVVKDGKIISKSGNRPRNDARFHAETQAILNAGKNLEGCSLYSTCEPCMMCFYMAWVTNISKICYGATIRDSIAIGIPEVNMSVNELNEKVENKIELKGGLLREECINLLNKTYQID